MTDSELVKSLRFEFLRLSKAFSSDVVLRNPMSISDFSRLCSLDNERDTFCKKADNLFTHQITEFIERNLENKRRVDTNHAPFLIKIHGHASSGKSTAIQQISKYLRDQVHAENFPLLPIYSEFHSADKSLNLNSTSIWNRFVAGTRSVDFRFDPASESIESFNKFVSESKIIPLLIIDTVDFLAIPKEENVGQDWSSFLDELIESGINVIFTVRTNEWKLNFEKDISLNVRKRMAAIALPELMLSEIDEYDYAEATNEKKFKQFTRVLGAFLPMLRNKAVIKKSGDFTADFSRIIDQWLELHTNNPTKSFKRNPISLFYNLSWRHIGIESSFAMDFKQTFEDYVLEELSQHFAMYKSGRIFFDEYEFYRYAAQQDMNSMIPVDECEELFDDLVDIGIIRRIGKLFEFHHHLFVEHIIEKSENIQPGMLLEFDREDERLYGCVKAWCGDKSSEIVRKHEKRVHEFYPRAKYDIAPEQEEEQEHKLLKFFSDNQDHRRIQLLSGSAGTGKSIYSLKFIDHQFHYRTTNARACYITKSKPLLQSQFSRWRFREMDGILRKYVSNWDDGKRNHELEFNSVKQLLEKIIPEEATGKKFVDFEEFSNLWRKEWEEKSLGRDSNRDSTSIEIAWLELTETFYDQFGEEDANPKFKYITEEKRQKGLIEFIKNTNAAPYSHWAYLARKNIIAGVKQNNQKYDIIVIDEVQDLHPSVVAFVMLLIKDPSEQEESEIGSSELRKNIAIKQLLLTGDEYQTLNQSGFDWVKMLGGIQKISHKERFDKQSKVLDKLNDIVNLATEDGTLYLEVLKYSYRNPESIVSFNRSAFRSYKLAFESITDSSKVANPTKDKFSKFETIVPRNKNYKPARIVFVPLADENYAKVLEHLNEVLWEMRQFLGSPQLLRPHEIDFDQISGIPNEKSLADTVSHMKIYSSDGVKGLETSAVCVMHPFELDKSSFTPGKRQEKQFSDTRYDISVKDISDHLMIKIHDNMMYRMNVLFTRSESLIFILWPGKLGTEPKDFWWQNDHYMRRVYPWSFNNLSQFKDVHQVNSYLDVDKNYLEHIFKGYTQELDTDYWERQALEALIRKDDDENQKKAFEQYFENVPEEERNIGHTIALLSGYSDHFLIPTLFGPQDPDLNQVGSKTVSSFQEKVTEFGISDNEDALLKIFDSIYLDENSPWVSENQKGDFEILNYPPPHYTDKNHPFRTPSDYLTIIQYLHDFITNIVLKDREYLVKTEYGERAILAIIDRLIPWDPFNSVKEFDEYLNLYLGNWKIELSKTNLEYKTNRGHVEVKEILRSDSPDTVSLANVNFPDERLSILSHLIGAVDLKSGVIPISNRDPYPNPGNIPHMTTINLVETIFRLSRISIHTRKYSNQLTPENLSSRFSRVDFWRFLIGLNPVPFGVNTKKFQEFILARYRNVSELNSLGEYGKSSFQSFLRMYIGYIHKNPEKVFSAIPKQNSNYDQPCFDILVEHLIQSVEIPEQEYTWKDQEYDWGDIDGMYLVTPLLIMKAHLSDLLNLNKYKEDGGVRNMVYERIYRELKILESGINPKDEKMKTTLADYRSTSLSQVLFCYQSFIQYLIANHPDSKYIARTNDIVVGMIQSFDKIKGKKTESSLVSVSEKKLHRFARGLFDVSQRQFGKYIGCSLILGQQSNMEADSINGLYYPSSGKINKLLLHVASDQKLTNRFSEGLIGSLRRYMNSENKKQQSLTKQKNKSKYLTISNRLKQICEYITANNIGDGCVEKIRILYGDIKPPFAVNLDRIHDAGDLDGWSVLTASEGKTSEAIDKRINHIFRRRCESIVNQLLNLERNRHKNLNDLRFIFYDYNQLTGEKGLPFYYQQVKPLSTITLDNVMEFNEWELSKPCPACGSHRKELNWARYPLAGLCDGCSSSKKGHEQSDYLLTLLFALHQVLSSNDSGKRIKYVSLDEALQSSKDNYQNNNPEVPIISIESDLFTNGDFGSYSDMLKSFRENIKTPAKSIIVQIAEKISNEYKDEKKPMLLEEWDGILDHNALFSTFDNNYAVWKTSVLMSRLDALMLSTIGCNPGNFFEIKDDENLVYNHKMAKLFVDDEIIERKLRKKKLDIALGRTRKPQQNVRIGSEEFGEKMEMLSFFQDKSTSPVEARRAIAKFAGKYENFKWNQAKRYVGKIKHQILSRYNKQEDDFVETKELLGVPTENAELIGPSDGIQSYFESSDIQLDRLVKVTNYFTSSIAQKSVSEKRLLTYVSTSWIDIEKLNKRINNATLESHSLGTPKEARQQIQDHLNGKSKSKLNYVRINEGPIQVARATLWDELFSECNQYFDWLGDTPAIQELFGSRIYQYNSLKEKGTEYIVDKINEYNETNDDNISFLNKECEDLFIDIVFRNFFLIEFHELVNNFYSLEKNDLLLGSMREEIEKILTNSPFSSTLQVVEMLTPPDSIERYDFIDLVEEILEKTQHPLTFKLLDKHHETVWVTKRLAKEENYNRYQEIS